MGRSGQAIFWSHYVYISARVVDSFFSSQRIRWFCKTSYPLAAKQDGYLNSRPYLSLSSALLDHFDDEPY